MKNKGQFVKGQRASIATEFKKGQHWRPRKPHWEREWLFHEYVECNRTAPDIAREIGCTAENVIYWLKKHGIPRRSTSETRAIKYWGASGEDNPMYGVRGEAHPNWKGGCTPERQAFYSSEAWLKVLTKVRRRDKYCCQRCGSGEEIHVHHIVSFAVEELRAELDNLVLLCQECHYWVHGPQNTDGEYIIDWKGGERE